MRLLDLRVFHVTHPRPEDALCNLISSEVVETLGLLSTHCEQLCEPEFAGVGNRQARSIR
jgi:hypothetical protein